MITISDIHEKEIYFYKYIQMSDKHMYSKFNRAEKSPDRNLKYIEILKFRKKQLETFSSFNLLYKFGHSSINKYSSMMSRRSKQLFMLIPTRVAHHIRGNENTFSKKKKCANRTY
jgi:hypothetical protein